MKEQLEQRLKGLKSEFERGQKVMADLESRRVTVRDTLLRISGAIQVIEEMLNGKADTMQSFQDTEEHKTYMSAAG